MAIFTVLAPPSSDPEFCLHKSAIGLLQRALQSSAEFQEFIERVNSTTSKHDGPAARVFEMLQHEAFQNAVQYILENKPVTPQFARDLRESWRKYVWKILASDRPGARSFTSTHRRLPYVFSVYCFGARKYAHHAD